jgi:hypothetical protein
MRYCPGSARNRRLANARGVCRFKCHGMSERRGLSATPASAVTAATVETATMKAAAVEAPVETSVEMREAEPEAGSHRKSVSVIGIGIPVIIGRVILVVPSIIRLTILSVIRIVAVDGSSGLWRSTPQDGNVLRLDRRGCE